MIEQGIPTRANDRRLSWTIVFHVWLDGIQIALICAFIVTVFFVLIHLIRWSITYAQILTWWRLIYVPIVFVSFPVIVSMLFRMVDHGYSSGGSAIWNKKPRTPDEV